MWHNVELCSGCGAVADQHPLVGLTRDEDGDLYAFPVCSACWRDPAHRQRTLDMSFFTRDEAARAIEAAGSVSDPEKRRGHHQG